MLCRISSRSGASTQWHLVCNGLSSICQPALTQVGIVTYIFAGRQAGGRAFGRSYVPRSWQGSRAAKRKLTLLPLLLTASRLSVYLLISLHRPLVFSITLSLYESWSLSAHSGSLSHSLWTKICCPTFFAHYPRVCFLLHFHWFLLCLLRLISLFARLSLHSVNVNLSLSGFYIFTSLSLLYAALSHSQFSLYTLHSTCVCFHSGIVFYYYTPPQQHA